MMDLNSKIFKKRNEQIKKVLNSETIEIFFLIQKVFSIRKKNFNDVYQLMRVLEKGFENCDWLFIYDNFNLNDEFKEIYKSKFSKFNPKKIKVGSLIKVNTDAIRGKIGKIICYDTDFSVYVEFLEEHDNFSSLEKMISADANSKYKNIELLCNPKDIDKPKYAACQINDIEKYNSLYYKMKVRRDD